MGSKPIRSNFFIFFEPRNKRKKQFSMKFQEKIGDFFSFDCFQCKFFRSSQKTDFSAINRPKNSIFFSLLSSHSLKTKKFRNPNITMSDPTTLIPNLQEVMEKYTELKNQTEQGFEATTRQVEERDDDNEENHKSMKEIRKRKMGADEAKAKKLISERTVALMEESLKNRGFIVERGFKNIISPFAEMVGKREWQPLAKHKEPGCASLVREFFANMVEREGKRVYVKGQWIDFSREDINKLFNLGVLKDGSKFRKQLREIEHQKIVDLLTTGKGEWKGTKINPFRSITRGDLT